MNKVFTGFVLGCGLLAPCSAFGQQTLDASQLELRAPLTAAEADRIVMEEMAEKQRSEADRKRRYLEADVLKRTQVDQGERQVIIEKIAPPPNQSPQPPIQAPKPNSVSEEPEPFAEPAKRSEMLMLSATVIDGQWTELRWRHDGERFSAISNVDFQLLLHTGSLSHEAADYSFIIAAGELDQAAADQRQTSLTQQALKTAPAAFEELLLSDEPRYFLLPSPDRPAPDEALEGIELLLDHYAANSERLKIDYQRREALRAARQRYETAHPKEPQDVVIRYWR